MKVSYMIIGNTTVTGFVGLVDGNRILMNTGNYTNAAGDKVYKDSITIFKDPKFDGVEVKKGDYIAIVGVDVKVLPNKGGKNPGEQQATVNVRFKNQLEVREAPVKKTAAEPAVEDV